MELLQNMATGRRVRERGLQQRGGRWHVRVAVPSDLVARVGRREMTASLGTGEYQVARHRVRQAGVLLDELFAYMRQKPELGAAELERMAKEWFARLKDKQESALAAGALTAETYPLVLARAEGGVNTYRQRLAMNDLTLARPAAIELLEEVGASTEGGVADKLARLLLRGSVAFAELAHAKYQGNYGVRPSDPLFADVIDNPPNLSAAKHTLANTVDLYLAEQQPVLRPGSYRKVEGVLSLLKRIYGPNVSMAAFTPASIQEYKATLGKLPANAVKKYGDLPIADLLLKAKDAPAMTRENANSHIQKTLGFLRWCEGNGYIGRIEVDNRIKFQTNSDPMSERAPFSPDQINALFSSPAFVGCKSASRRSEPGKSIVRDDWFWLPILGLYSGGRLSELASLRVEDVKSGQEESGEQIFWIEFNPVSYGSKLKTKQSQRIVPIHPELISLGFIHYVEKMRKARQERLFPNCKPSRPEAHWSDKPSRWFLKYIKAVGVQGVTFHSLRHSFNDCMKDGDAQDSEIAALMGHKLDSETFGRYGTPRHVSRLYKALLKGQFPSLPHLYSRKA